MKIRQIIARQILDSRGIPTVEADVMTDTGAFGRAAVPSGVSTGSSEALELRDGDAAYGGKGVGRALRSITEIIFPALHGRLVTDQNGIDQMMRELDGTQNKSRLGANAILAVSLACARAAAAANNIPLFRYIGELAGNSTFTMPTPMISVINGGKHASGSLDLQEFMIIPKSGATFAENLRMGAEIFYALKTELIQHGYDALTGDEGGYAPRFREGSREALVLMSAAVAGAGYGLGTDVQFALDVAASELRQEDSYHLPNEGRRLSALGLTEWYNELSNEFPIVSIEDGLSKDDWGGWTMLTSTLGQRMQLVGDDLLVTNAGLLQKAIAANAGNAILIKPNQIGSLTETIEAVRAAKNAGWGTIIGHRSGETEDTTIAHLAVGLNAGQIKAGSLSRSELLAKYNELLRIEELLAAEKDSKTG